MCLWLVPSRRVNDDEDPNVTLVPNDEEFAYDVFLSHNWGENDRNHIRVHLLREKLVDLGAKVWLDDINFEGTDINREMVRGVLQSRVSDSSMEY